MHILGSDWFCLVLHACLRSYFFFQSGLWGVAQWDADVVCGCRPVSGPVSGPLSGPVLGPVSGNPGIYSIFGMWTRLWANTKKQTRLNHSKSSLRVHLGPATYLPTHYWLPIASGSSIDWDEVSQCISGVGKLFSRHCHPRKVTTCQWFKKLHGNRASWEPQMSRFLGEGQHFAWANVAQALGPLNFRKNWGWKLTVYHL